MLIILTLIVSTFIACFSISHIFLSVFLYESRKELTNIKSDIFSYMFGLSNVLLVMIVLEISDVDDDWYFK
jgi:hypothetical protein